MVSSNEERRAVQRRYLRQKEKAMKLGFNDLEKIKKEWNLFEAGELA